MSVEDAVSPAGPAVTPDSAAASLLQGEHYRLTPLTPRVIRLEWSPSGHFEDRPTTFALNRELSAFEYQILPTDTGLRIITDYYVLDYDRGPFTTNGLSAAVRGGISNYHSVWRYKQDLSLPSHRRLARTGHPFPELDGNMGGAARTLDVADGPVDLEPGVVSELGYAVIDDSKAMVFDAEGRLAARHAEPGSQDLYLFAGGHDHVETVGDLFAISGSQPLLPRFALGNWWSRYHRYDEAEYLELMDRFDAEKVPFSVAVIDMDWHLTDIDPKFGSGWTGYTWDRGLFPDPQQFQAELHRRGLKTTLNVHPADGIRAFEEPYPAICQALGRPADGHPVDFDVTDRAFMDAYFSVLHRGLEKMGTDFWWIDWQSGPYSKIPGMDPLWVLNHGHYVDSATQMDRGLIFSRYAGPGSHRYPVGFSGDSLITWKSLAFQPRFTAAGANIGYGWWSHDIGGHMEGYKNDELATRWVEFGVFSPVMRLHSSSSRFSGKEPWKYSQPGRQAMIEHLRLRHRMLPYLNAMNLRAHRDGRSIVEPVYYEDHSAQAYKIIDEFLFGSQLLVAPIIGPNAPVLQKGHADVWLPEGRWTDIVTGRSYDGGQGYRMWRGLESIPVLLRAGGFLPLVAPGESLDIRTLFPQLEVLVAAGASGRFDLEEETPDGEWQRTVLELDAQAGVLRITPAEDDLADRRDWTLTLLGFSVADGATFEVEGGELTGVELAESRVTVRVRAGEAAGQPAGPLVIRSRLLTTTGQPDSLAAVEALLADAQTGFILKDEVYRLVAERGRAALAAITSLGRSSLGHLYEVHDYDAASPELISALTEILATTESSGH
ncbi:TIM-barrel domain-containing protein [Acidipropionibacterium thoenii]|uniref:glycoside hydrolase family 31 protein n=1 Tax=Acidipropionibacterium thoenii TaxID=1751 RepID=UPI000424701C|nr:TIM-barrel domain-containing protein [Acidipropionibacterium thoenii]